MFDKLLKTLELLRRSASTDANVLNRGFINLVKNVVPTETLISLLIASLPVSEEKKGDIMIRIVDYCNSNNLDVIDLLLNEDTLDNAIEVTKLVRDISEVWSNDTEAANVDPAMEIVKKNAKQRRIEQNPFLVS